MFQITVVADGETIWNMCSFLLYRKVKSLETERPAPVRSSSFMATTLTEFA